mmetsp:Transcript_39980/g.125107  ORF Transcript_39980/g.125107 Transcript_39980/m.125107 type:complete len:398 (+) Transcript_39980:3554-4747(+)
MACCCRASAACVDCNSFAASRSRTISARISRPRRRCTHGSAEAAMRFPARSRRRSWSTACAAFTTTYVFRARCSVRAAADSRTAASKAARMRCARRSAVCTLGFPATTPAARAAATVSSKAMAAASLSSTSASLSGSDASARSTSDTLSACALTVDAAAATPSKNDAHTGLLPFSLASAITVSNSAVSTRTSDTVPAPLGCTLPLSCHCFSLLARSSMDAAMSRRSFTSRSSCCIPANWLYPSCTLTPACSALARVSATLASSAASCCTSHSAVAVAAGAPPSIELAAEAGAPATATGMATAVSAACCATSTSCSSASACASASSLRACCWANALTWCSGARIHAGGAAEPLPQLSRASSPFPPSRRPSTLPSTASISASDLRPGPPTAALRLASVL